MSKAFMWWIYRSIVAGSVAVVIIPFAVMMPLLWPLWAAVMSACFYCNYRARTALRDGEQR